MNRPIAITPGEPAGIGPDIAVQLAQQKQAVPIVAFADPDLLLERAKQLNLPLKITEWNPSVALPAHQASTLSVAPVKLKAPCQAGQPNAGNIPYVIETLSQASNACLNKQCRALVTGPVHKGLFQQAGVSFLGHTEFLAEYTRSPQVVMMLATEDFRVALMTTHLPLRDVPDAITPSHIKNIITVVHKTLSGMLKKNPRIFVLGLNPHAGDDGALGTEEQEIIIPALAQLREQDMYITGPLSADTAFSAENLAAADVFIAMYHDQGLPVLKTQSFGEIVNITLGLNIVRTSVDHGTAFSLAGTGKAQAHSLQQAIATAINFSSP